LRVEDAMRPAPMAPAGAPGPSAGQATAGQATAGQATAGQVVYPDESLDTALRAFGTARVLHVVSRRDVTHVLGLLTLEDVLRAYGIAGGFTPEFDPGRATADGSRNRDSGDAT
jgi:hypothetical protein